MSGTGQDRADSEPDRMENPVTASKDTEDENEPDLFSIQDLDLEMEDPISDWKMWDLGKGLALTHPLDTERV